MAYKVLTHPLPVNLFQNLDAVKPQFEVSEKVILKSAFTYRIGVLATPEYVFGESIETNTAEDVAISAGEYVGGGLATSAGTRAVGQVMMGVGTVVGKAGGSEAAGWSLCTVLRGAIIDKAGSNLLKGFKKSLLDPFALFGAIANFVIDHDSNSIENANKKGAVDDRTKYDGDDAGNGINVVAVD